MWKPNRSCTDPTARAIRLLAFAMAALGFAASGFAEDRDIANEGFYQSYVLGKPNEPSDAWKIAYGGRLYDEWWAVLLDDPPIGTHPAADIATGTASWRCVTCHGWNYRGEGPGSSTDLAPLRDADPGRVVAALRDAPHGFSPAMIPEAAAEALALFVTRGQHGDPDMVDTATGRFRGDPARGREIFQNVCAICHDYDGRAWIEGDTETGNTLGALSKAAPKRVLHKVLNGQTYADMPAMRVFGLPTVLDVLSYVQTLPED